MLLVFSTGEHLTPLQLNMKTPGTLETSGTIPQQHTLEFQETWILQPLLVPSSFQINTACVKPFYFLKVNINIAVPSTFNPSKCSSPLFPPPRYCTNYFLPHTCHTHPKFRLLFLKFNVFVKYKSRCRFPRILFFTLADAGPQVHPASVFKTVVHSDVRMRDRGIALDAWRT